MARWVPRHRGITWIVGILLLGSVARERPPDLSVEIRPTLNDLEVKIEQTGRLRC